MFMLKRGKEYASLRWVKAQSSHFTHNAQQAASNTSDCTYKQDDKKFGKINYLSFAIQNREDASWEEIKQNSSQAFPVKLRRVEADFWCSEK